MKPLKRRIKSLLLKTVWSFGPDDLISAIRKLGVKPGDVLMVHAGWRPDSGFRGSVQELVQAFIDSVGPDGTLCMMSMPFHGMTMDDYLKLGKVFDVRRTVSMVGLPSEIFRRRKGVMRSLHPTHSVAACGPKTSWLIENHEKCESPFGLGSPFDKMVECGGKILLYDVPFNVMTFEHYLEDRIKDKICEPLYNSTSRQAFTLDYEGRMLAVPVRVLNQAISSLRRSDLLERLLIEKNVMLFKRLRRLYLGVVLCKDSVAAVSKKSLLCSPFHDPGS